MQFLILTTENSSEYSQISNLKRYVSIIVSFFSVLLHSEWSTWLGSLCNVEEVGSWKGKISGGENSNTRVSSE